MKLNWKLELTSNQVFFALVGLLLYVLLDQIFNNQVVNLGAVLGILTGALFFKTKPDGKAFLGGVFVFVYISGLMLAASLAVPTSASPEVANLGKIIFNVLVGNLPACFVGFLISIYESEAIKEKVEEKNDQK